MNSGIYKILNKVNYKIYIGLSRDLKFRELTHFKDLKNNKHKNCHLQRAYNIYGRYNFVFEVIEYCSIELLYQKEHYWATILKVHSDEYGYNIRPTDTNGKSSHSLETRLKISKKNKGRVGTRLGHKFSHETKHKMSLAALGKKPSIEAIEKTRIAKIGKKLIRKVEIEKLNKAVYQYDKNLVFIEEHISIRIAAEKTGAGESHIGQVCIGKRKSAAGFIWKFKIINNEI